MQYAIGDVIEGIITGIQPYGAFVYIDDAHSGLIHISEISDRFVKDVGNYLKINERVKVKILEIDVEGDHLKLSLKAVESNKARFRHQYHRNEDALPTMVIGFATLALKLDSWIDEASR